MRLAFSIAPAMAHSFGQGVFPLLIHLSPPVETGRACGTSTPVSSAKFCILTSSVCREQSLPVPAVRSKSIFPEGDFYAEYAANSLAAQSTHIPLSESDLSLSHGNAGAEL